MDRHRDDNTRYGRPPLRDNALPDEVPWNTHIHLLTGLAIRAECSRCPMAGGEYPLRLLAAEKARHKAKLAERRAARKFERGDDFIGPPDPRKGRLPMTR